MNARPRTRASDMRGISRLTIDAIVGVVDLVEALHYNIASVPGIPGKAKPRRTTGITGLVYRSIGGTIGLVGQGLDQAARDAQSPARRGKHMARARGRAGGAERRAGRLPRGLARIRWRSPCACAATDSRLPMEAQALAAAIPQRERQDPRARARPVHERSAMERQGARSRRRAGARSRLHAGLSALQHRPARLRSTAARSPSCSRRCCEAWPVPVDELAIIGHSMGGLVARSACHYGALARPRLAAAPAQARLPRHAAPRRAAGARRQLGRHAARESARTRRRSRASARSAAPASPTCATATCWTRTGKGATASQRTGDVRNVGAAAGGRAVLRHRRDDRQTRRATSATDCSATASCRWTAPWVATRSRRLALTFPESRQWIGYGMNHLRLAQPTRGLRDGSGEWLASPGSTERTPRAAMRE